MKLTASQQTAVVTCNRNIGLLASAGSGKTSVLSAHYEWLLSQLRESPKHILVFTFTEKAALELKNRIEEELRFKPGDSLIPSFWSEATIGTIHRFCTKICRENAGAIGLKPDFTIQDPSLTRMRHEALLLSHLEEEMCNPSSSLTPLLNHYGLENVKQLLFSLHRNSLTAAPDLSPNPHGTSLLALHRTIEKKLAEEKSRGNHLDFDDLETHAISILENFPEIREHYQRRFHHILVDEFQDLNDAEGRLIELLSRPDLNHLFFVGDPKQAIYGFRGGNVEIFNRFFKSLEKPNGSPLYLNENFRAALPLISFANALFSRLFEKSEIPYTPMEAMKEQDGRPSQVVYQDLAGDTLDERRREEALSIAHSIEKLREDRLPYREIAVLSRSASFFELLTPILREKAIPFALEKSRPLAHEPFVLFLQNLLLALLDETDELAKIGLQNSGRFKIDPQAPPLAARFQNGEKPSERLEWFRENAEESEAGSIFKESREVFLYFRFLECLAWEEANGLGDAPALRSFFSRLDRHSPFSPAPSKGEEEAVSLLTVHASKGLEFEAVFIADLSGRSRSDRPLSLNSQIEEERGFGKKFASTTESEEMDDARKGEKADESKRLFYVAVTRAKRLLFFHTTPLSPAKEKSIAKADNPYVKLSSWNDWIEVARHSTFPGLEP